MHEIADKAEAVTNPLDVGWQDLFISRFVGAMPDSITEVPRVLVLSPDTVTPEPDGSCSVCGFFEHSTNGVLANIRSISGTLHPSTREFVLRDQGQPDTWAFAGTLSPNGRVMHLCITYEGYTTDAFFLIHEDTFADLIPPDPA